jgi:hypothetical protein
MVRPSSYRRDDAAQSCLGQNDSGGRLGDICGRRDRNAHLRLAQRRGIVGPVPAHANGVAALLECLNQTILVFGENAGKDPESIRT